MKIQITQPITVATNFKEIYTGLVSVKLKKIEFTLKWNEEDTVFENNKIIYFDLLDSNDDFLRKFAIECSDEEIKQAGDSMLANENCCLHLIDSIFYELIKSKIIDSLNLAITLNDIDII